MCRSIRRVKLIEESSTLLLVTISFNYSGACTGRVYKFLSRVEGGGQKGGKVFKQMCVNESLNYSDRCMQFYFIFSMEDEGAQEWQHGSKKNVIVDR